MAVRKNTYDDKEVSCSLKRAKTSACDEKKDFFCDLPDDILVHILSFLPIKDAISTVCLRRFGNLWRHIRVLDFDQCIYPYFNDLDSEHSLNFRKFIRHLLNRLESPILDKFIFKFDFAYADIDDDGAWENGVRYHFEMLIRYALSKQVKVLEFDLWDDSELLCPDDFYDLPPYVFNSNYLTDLKLAGVDIMLCETINLKSLKVLSLDNVTLDDQLMENILVGCPLLEDLSVINCNCLKNLVCKNSNLKKVTLALSDKEEGEPLIISCPHVLSLDINGFLQRAWLLRSSPSADISVFYSQFSCVRKHAGVRIFLKKVNTCNTFRACSWTILVFTIWNLRNLPCPSFGWKKLVLNIDMMKWHLPGLSLLLRNSQSLETLTINIFSTSLVAKMFFERPKQAEWMKEHEFDMDNFWISQKASFPSLKIIKINGYVNESYVIQMVHFLLRSATSLEKLVISPQKLSKLNHAQERCYNI